MSCMKDYFFQVFMSLFNPIIFHDFSLYSNIKSFKPLLGDVGFKFSTNFLSASILYLFILSLASLLDYVSLVLKYKKMLL